MAATDADLLRKDNASLLMTRTVSLEEEISRLKAIRDNDLRPLQQKVFQLKSEEYAYKLDNSDRQRRLETYLQDRQRLQTELTNLLDVQHRVQRLREAVDAQRRAIILIYRMLAFNAQGTAHGQSRNTEVQNLISRLTAHVGQKGAEAEDNHNKFDSALFAKRSELEALEQENLQIADDLGLQVQELDLIEANHREKIVREQERVRALEEKLKERDALYDECQKMLRELNVQSEKVSNDLVRPSIGLEMERRAREIEDEIDGMKTDEWLPGIRIELTQYVSVNWGSGRPYESEILVSTHSKTGLKLSLLPNPFAMGTFRSAWYAKDSTGKEYIAKKFHVSWRNELKKWMTDKSDGAAQKRDRDSVEKVIKMNRVCQDAIEAFDQALKDVGHEFNLSFVDIWMAEETETRNVWFLEEPLPKFERFTNNDQFADNSTDHGQLMSCFEHFSFEHYGKRFIVTDLQGFHEDRTFRLSDPALHILKPSNALSSIQHFMDGDRGLTGLAGFLKKHECNHYCEALELPELPTLDDLNNEFQETTTDPVPTVEDVEKVRMESRKLREAYQEFEGMKRELEDRRAKAELDVIRPAVIDVLARCEEELTDIERIKTNNWRPGVRINLIQYLSVEWESFNHQMRVSTQEKTGVQLFLLSRPFAKGTLRSAWYAKDSNGNEYIAKKFHASWRKELNEFMSDKSEEAGRKRDRDSVDKVILMNRVCQVTLQAFNQALKSVGHNFELSFVDIWMAVETDTGNVWFLEEPLPKFDRFTNNADFADDTTEQGRLMGCFEHFSLEHYGRRFVVTDLQGFQEGRVLRLSDPALNILRPSVALSSIEHFMDGNRGIFGFIDLLKKHKCNEFCNALRLSPLPKYEDLMRGSAPVVR